MTLIRRFKAWRARARRQRLIRRQLEAFSRIDPALYQDIGLYPQNFREEAERLADCQMQDQACAQGLAQGLAQGRRQGSGQECATCQAC